VVLPGILSASGPPSAALHRPALPSRQELVVLVDSVR
jgi:hypothetical protein